MNDKKYIEKFINDELTDNDYSDVFSLRKDVLYYNHYNTNQWLAKHYEDFIIIKFRDDVKPGIKKLLKQLPKDKKVLLMTREIEYLKDPHKMDHVTCITNIIYYFVKGWIPFFEKNKLDIFKMIFDYVDYFDCSDDMREAVELTTTENYRRRNRFAFKGKWVIGGYVYDEQYETIHQNYLDKFIKIFRNYKLYQLFGSDF